MIHKPQEQWESAPLDRTVNQRADVLVEAKPTTTVLTSHCRAVPSTWFNVNQFGTRETVMRTTARIQQAFANAVRTNINKPVRRGELNASELQQAKLYWFRALQATAYPEELKAMKRGKPVASSSRILLFRPYLDEKDGLIKMDARNRPKHLITPNVPIIPKVSSKQVKNK